jgi:type 1 fimbria pilin
MHNDFRGCPLRIILALLALLLVCPAASAAELFGTVDAVSGSAVVVDQTGKSTPITDGLKIYEGQTINSEQDGEVHLVTEDGGIIAVRPNTVFRVDEYKAEGNDTDKIFMSLLKGTVRSITGWVGKFNNSAYRITTPTATIGIRGTDHETTVIEKGDGDEAGTYDNVNEGSTELRTPHGVTAVTPGKFAFAPKGRAVAPFFLAQQPRFLARRMLRIEARIQQRKEFFHSRLGPMREERISHPRVIHPLNPGVQHGSPLAQRRERVVERRKEFRERRMEQAGHPAQARRMEKEHSPKRKQGQFKSHPLQRRELVNDNGEKEKEKQRIPERKLHERMKRD